MASATGTATSHDFQFFAEIIDAFKAAGASAYGDSPQHMHVTPFVDAMTMFLRVFDAFSNPFFSDVVKKDVEGNIKVSWQTFASSCPPRLPMRERRDAQD